MDDSLFRQKGPGQVPRGVTNQAEDAVPSDQSGGVRIGTPVWRQFVANKDFQENNAGAIDAEVGYQRQVEKGNALAGSEIFKGANGKLIHKVGRHAQEVNAEDFVDHPVAGAEARKSLWDREVKTTKQQAADIDFKLKDPAFHARGLSKKDRANIEAEGSALPETDPRHAELKKRLVDDDAYQSEKKALAQQSYDTQARARQIESTDPESWWKSRTQPTAQEKRSTTVADAQAQRSEADAADQAAAARETELRTELSQGVKGPDVAAKKAELAQIASDRGRIAQERAKSDQQMESVKAQAATEAKPPARDALAKALQGANLFGSATSAMGQAADKNIRRKSDGNWDLPFLMQPPDNAVIGAIAGITQTIAQKTGARLDSAGMAVDKNAIQKVFHDFQQANNLSDAEVQAAWSDLGNQNRKWSDGETARVLSDGTLLPNYGNSDWLDDQKAQTMIDSSSAAPQAKANAMRNLKSIQETIAGSKLEAYAAASVGTPLQSPTDWAVANDRMKDFGTVQFVRDYDEQVAKKAGWGTGLVTDFHQGNIKLANTLAGFAGVLGSDAAGQAGAELSQASSLMAQGSPDTGLIGAAIEEAPSIFTQIALTRGIGAAAGGLGASANTVRTVGTIGALATAGGQSAGATFSAQIAAGDSPELAREKAIKSGISTAVITGIFQKLGAGGVEKVAAGRSVGEVTMRDLFKSATKAELLASTRTFATDIVKSVAGEAAEEGIDELTQAFLTADPDTNLADAWDNAVQAAKVGGFIGGVVDVGAKAFEGHPSETPAGPNDRLKERVDAGIAAVDPEAEPASPEEIAKASTISNPADGAEAVADSVLIERELAGIEAADEGGLQAYEQRVEEAIATGDKTLISATEAQRSKVLADSNRAPTVRAVLKIAGGQQLDDLTSAELTSIGFKDSGDSFAPMTAKELKDAGITAPLIRQGADGSIIITDGALKKVGEISTRARDRVKMTEAEAIQKAKVRASQPVSTESQNGGTGDPSTGLPTGVGVVPNETNAPVEFDVPMRDGTTLRVQAKDGNSALEEAAAQAPISGQPPTPVSNVTNPQGQPDVQSQVSPPVQLPEVSDGTPGAANHVTDSSKPAGSGKAKAKTEAEVASPGAKALAAAKKRLEKVKKNKRLASVLTEGKQRAITTPDGITLNPEQIVQEAITSGMNEAQAAEYFTRVLDEEIRHLAQYDAARILWKAAGSPGGFKPWMDSHYGEIWQAEFVDAGKADIARTLYAGTDNSALAQWDAMPDASKAMEAIRMMSQGSTVTEAAKLWADIGDRLRAALEAALQSLKELIDIASPTLKSEITNLENALKQLTTKPRGGNPKTVGKKPTASKPGDGNRGPSEDQRAGSASVDGGTEQARSDSAGSPLGVGAKVEFERDGERVTGVVALLMNGHARVRPDSNPAISFAVKEDALTVLAAPADLKGERINKEWVAYSEESHSLGIPRAEMPQIHSTDRSAMVQFLKARGIDYVEEEVLPDSLKPTQLEYSPAKVEKAREHVGGNRALLVSDDGHLVDGHHQWMAALDDPTTPVRVIRLMAPIREILDVIHDMPSVGTADGQQNSTGERTGQATDLAVEAPVEPPVSQVEGENTDAVGRRAPATPTVQSESEVAAQGRWTPEVQKAYAKFKSSLKKAQKSKDWAKVITESDRALAYFEKNAFPDDWNNWVRAKEDAEQAIKRAPVLSDADKALLEAMDGLFAAALPESFSKPVPPDRIGPLVTVATKYITEGITTPEALAQRLGALADGKMRQFSQSIWFAFKMAGTPGAAEPDWADVYGRLDNQAVKADSAVDETTPQSDSGGQSPEASSGLEPGVGGPMDSKPSSENAGSGAAQQLSDNGGSAGSRGDSGTVRGNGSRPGVGTGDRKPTEPGTGTERGGKRSPQGTDSVNTGDGSRVAGGEQPTHSPGRTGYRLTDPERIFGSGGPKARFARNKLALETFDTVLSEQRDPTPEEQDILAAYIGWGSFGQELFQGSWDRPNPKPEWQEESDWLRDHLGQGGWESIRDSIINAHYTDPPHVEALWRIAQHLGFKGGRVLEPSMGIGSFFGLMPDVLRAKSSLTGIELDRVVGGMAQMLYPDANIRIMGYEKSATADGFYDLVIGNWPFAKDGPSDPRYNSLGLSLHDYFFVKALDQVRPGGLVIGITSSGTMDKKGQTARRQMARRAELVGAFRFPSGAFEKYAGTKVVTDVVILKKRGEAASGVEADGWINTEEFGTGDQKFNANEYWRKNPDHVLGEMTFGHGTTQGRAGMIVNRPSNYAEILATVENALPKDILSDAPATVETKSFQNREAGADQNSVTWNDGDATTPAGFYVVRGEQLEPLEKVFSWRLKEEQKTEKRRDELKKLLGLRQSVQELLAAQRDGDPKTEAIRKTAKERYDALVKAHGPIAKSFMVKAMDKAADPMALTLKNLERAEGGKFVPREILLKDIMRRPVTDANGSIEDAYAIQRNQSTALDVDSIAEISGSTVDQVIDRLVGLDQIYKTPSGVWESREEYLGGNVRRKLREAKDAKSQGLDMDRNIPALEAIQPKDVAYFEIEVQMGASWIPRENYLEFASHLLGGEPANAASDFELTKASSGWNFKVANKSLAGGTNANATWGTARISFSKIFQAAMNGTTVKIYDTTETKAKVLNEQETELANKKIDDIREELTNWLWSDPERTGKLASDYNEVMNSEVVPQRSGSHLRFEGLALTLGSSEFDFRQHQKDAVWRFIMDGRGVGAHEVGTGKTFTMAGLAVEGRRLGKFRKSLVFAHNANSESVFRDFQSAYPGGKFLYIDNLSPENRDNAMRQIATDEWDAVVVPHSLIDRFALREETLMEIANKQIIQMESEIADALDELGVGSVDINDEEDVSKKLGRVKDSHTAKELVKARNRIIKRIKDKAAKGHKDNAVFFEDLGVDSIMVDEAHMFKKIALATRKEVKGLNKTESERGWMLGALTDTIKARNNGKGVFLFTGTPLTNNLNEAYNMMRFVMDDAMSDVGIDGFDDWFNAFAASVTDVELTTGGTFEPVSRLLSFINVPELARLAGRYFDVVLAKNMPEFVPRDTEDGKSPNAIGRPFKKVRPVTAEMSPEQKAHKADIQRRYEWFQGLKGRDKRKAMLQGVNTPIQLETEGIKAALDMRMVNHAAEDYQDSKVNMMIRNAVDHYTEDETSTQMIFMEQGWNDFTDAQVAVRDGNGIPLRTDDGKKVTRKERRRQFNLARDMVEKLVAKGVRPEEIAVFSNMSLDPIADRPGDVLRRVNRVSGKVTKEDLAAQMREGKIRFAIGSTQTMGTGVNAQNKMRAMHHLDAPWTPGEFEQRNGRGHRQGNEWNTVFEYRYFTEGSHDGRRWQVLLNKVKFISRFTEMLIDAGGSDLRVLAGDGADLGEEGSNVSDFEQSFSTAAGDPRILVRAKLRTDVDKLERKRDAHFQSIARAKGDIKSLLSRKQREGKTIAETEKVIATVTEAREKPFSVTIDGKSFTERKDAEEYLAAYPSLTQKDDGKSVMDFHGIEVIHDWNSIRSLGDQSGFYAVVPIKGGSPVKLRMGKLSIASLENNLRGQTRALANLKESYDQIDASVASLEEMIRKPFTREPELEAKTNALQQIEVELNRAPQPAPSWLRNGAPVGSLVYLADGKAYDVAAHRWDENGWWVLVEDGTGMRPIDYRKALDDSGHPMFEDVPFVAPDSSKAGDEDAAVSDDTAAFGKFIDHQEGRGLEASPLPRLRADSPEWKAMSKGERMEYLKTGLRASPLPESTGNTFKKRVPVSKPLTDEARRQQEVFGKNVSSGKLAGFGDERSRAEQDIVDAVYEFQKAVKSNADAMEVARKRLAADPADIEAKLLDAVTDKDFALDTADHLAMQMLINQRSAEAGNDLSKHADNMALRMAYRLMRGDVARTLQVGYDRNMTPAERALASITDAIYTPSKKVEKLAMGKPLSQRKAFFRQAAEARVKQVEAELRKMGVTLGEIMGENDKLKLANSEMMKQVAKLRKTLDQDILKMVQAGASIADIKRRYGKEAAETAQEVNTKAREELRTKIAPMIAAGMTMEQIVAKMGALSASDLPGSAQLTPEQIEAEIERVLAIGFGLPKEIPQNNLPRPRKPKPAAPVDTNPLTSDWSRPVFTDGLNSYEFDTKDRAGIMSRVESIRSLAGAMGKINTLTDDNLDRATSLLGEINGILAKYGTDAAGIFSAAKPIEDYRFNIGDINHVSAIARAISAIDADWIDKASEVLYANMLSGLQTMAVNATAIVPAAWETTVGRGVEMAINLVVRDPMAAQIGEEKYILRALGPAITRAMSNFSASFTAQHPMFDRDVLNHEVDWDKILGGSGYRTGGSISGKKGDIVRIPMRILASTDDFNRTLMACVEVGTFAYRIAKAQGMKPGSPEFDRFLKVQVNTPGSMSYELAAQKASRAIFSNALPGQKDNTTGKTVPVNDIGDLAGWAAASLNKFASQQHENMFAKAGLAALRICFFPFQRTPFNILRKGVRYTLNPFSLFDIGLGIVQNSRGTAADGTTQWKWNANGRNPELIERFGQQLQGAILMMLLAAAGAGEGDDDDQDKPFVITGSAPFTPQGRAEREAQMRSGIGPYRISFRRRDGSERFGFNYGRLEPLATTLAASIDLMKSVKRANRSGKGAYDAASEALGGLASQAQDKSFMKGISDLVALVTNLTAQPDLQENRKFQQFLAGRVAMVIPNIIKQPIREADGLYRERSNDFMQELLYQIVPYGQKEAKIDPYGRQAVKTGNPVGRVVDVTDAGTDQVHPIDAMLLRFRDKHPGEGWFPSPIVSAEFKHPVTGKNMKMSEAQLSEFRTMAGKRTDAILKREVVNLANPSMMDVEKVKKAVTQARSDVKKMLSYKFSRQ